MNQLDVAFASELHSCKQIEALSLEKEKTRKLLISEEMRQLGDFYEIVRTRKSSIAAIQTQNEIKAYLCDTEHVPVWLLASSVISRIQNRYVMIDLQFGMNVEIVQRSS